MGGSFSAVTLALLETPTEEIPPFIPALRDPVGVSPGSPRAAAEFRSARQQQLLQKVLDTSSQGLHLPAEEWVGVPCSLYRRPSSYLGPQGDLDLD